MHHDEEAVRQQAILGLMSKPDPDGARFITGSGRLPSYPGPA